MIDTEKKKYIDKKDFEGFMTDFLISWGAITNTLICIKYIIQHLKFIKELDSMSNRSLIKFNKGRNCKM